MKSLRCGGNERDRIRDRDRVRDRDIDKVVSSLRSGGRGAA